MHGIEKVPSGIAGLDEITGGGLPKGRTTLVCGGAGCGKTLFGMEFLINGAREHGDPGVLLAFEETADEIAKNVASLGFDVQDLVERSLLTIDFVKIDRSEIQEAGEYDLEGLFVRLDHAIKSVKAKRVVLDTLEALFAGFTNEALLRSELRRLFHWLKDTGVTAVITGERGEGTLTRYGIEEYVSDCVISLDNRVEDQISTRRMRIVKYRGSAHGANEYPFLIDDGGFSVLPVTSLGLNYEVSYERVPTGVPALDDMLEGGGYFRGASILVSGTAGTGKSSLAGLFADASCRRKEKALYFALEESGSQIRRNMRSIGLDLDGWCKKGLLKIQAARPSVFGLEMHLVTIHKLIEEFEPRAVVVDPLSSLVTTGNVGEVKSMLVRLFDYLKMKQITCLVTSLTSARGFEETEVGISSLIDTWFQVRDIEIGGERTRGLYLVKSRGMGHSNQIREFLITSKGVNLIPVAVGPNGVLTGSARVNQETEQRAQALARQQEIERKQRALLRKSKALDNQIEAMRAELAAEEEEQRSLATELHDRQMRLTESRTKLAEGRRKS
ncbi:MAG: circadian clock protein KaiC [Deltaproteobacteria bacterium]|nr:circadian clock protein KaiC [Deltaproteobacteria bacterium]